MIDKCKPLYIIGDVHGCYKSLCALIEQLPSRWDSQIILVGDLISRGPCSCEVVDLVMKHQYLCLMGNHEELMLEYYHKIPQKGYKNTWIKNGGYEALESYMRNGGSEKIHEHLDWMVNLPRYLEIDYPNQNQQKLFLTHGFGLPFFEERESKAEMITWSRLKSHDWQHEGNKPSLVFNVFGHDVQSSPLIMKNFAAIDTGCVYIEKYQTASLTALEWPSQRIFRQDYCEII